MSWPCGRDSLHTASRVALYVPCVAAMCVLAPPLAARQHPQPCCPLPLPISNFPRAGTQVPNEDGSEADGKDEAICPCDMNLIHDADLALIFAPLEARNIKLTFVADCCHRCASRPVRVPGRGVGLGGLCSPLSCRLSKGMP